MQCVKTGADVYLHDHGAVAHGDLYLIDGVYVLNTKGCSDWAYSGVNKSNISFFHTEIVGNSDVLACRKMHATQLHMDAIDHAD